MRSLLPILLLVPAAIAQRSQAFPGPNNSVELPQCPNGESPKLDKQGALIQCLPGAGQHSVCGPVHTCFFSGMNYMCCPTNEPPADAPPVCPNGLMTVTDARNHVVRCIPGRKACPAGGQLCLHTGREREHVCCQKFLARPSTPKPSAGPIDAGDDEVVQKVSCPAKSLAVLGNNGNTIACSANEPCPGASHICFGTTKRAICCQEQAQKHLSLSAGSAMVDHTSGHASDAAAKAVKETVKEGLKRKAVKENGKVDKRQQFLEAVQPSSPVQSMNDGEMTMKPVRRVKKVRKTTSTSTTTTSTTASPEEYEYYYVDENGQEETTTAVPTTTTTTEAPTTTRKIRRRKIKTTSAPVQEEEETTTEAVAEIVEAVEGVEEKEEKSYESGETAFRNRPRAQEIDANAITEPQFARPPARARAAKTLTGPVQPNTEGRKQMAQKYIMRHIRNGWPYNENYYRPDVTDAPESTVFVQ